MLLTLKPRELLFCSNNSTSGETYVVEMIKLVIVEVYDAKRKLFSFHIKRSVVSNNGNLRLQFTEI